MSIEALISWGLANQPIVALFALAATIIGGLYRPVRDLISALPSLAWNIVKFTLLIVWMITWPIRALITWLYLKYGEAPVERFFDKIFEYFEKREAAREKLPDSDGL